LVFLAQTANTEGKHSRFSMNVILCISCIPESNNLNFVFKIVLATLLNSSREENKSEREVKEGFFVSHYAHKL
jgi:hypothetical protein